MVQVDEAGAPADGGLNEPSQAGLLGDESEHHLPVLALVAVESGNFVLVICDQEGQQARVVVVTDSHSPAARGRSPVVEGHAGSLADLVKADLAHPAAVDVQEV